MSWIAFYVLLRTFVVLEKLTAFLALHLPFLSVSTLLLLSLFFFFFLLLFSLIFSLPPPLPRIFRLLNRYKWINYCFLWRFRSSSFFTKFAHGIPSTKLICCHLSHPVDNNRFWMQHNNKILNKLYSVKWPFLYLS